MCGRSYRVPSGNRSRLSSRRNSAVHYPSNPQFHETCLLQRFEKAYGRPEKVYAAPDEQIALSNLEEFGEKWDDKNPMISKSRSEQGRTWQRIPSILRP